MSYKFYLLPLFFITALNGFAVDVLVNTSGFSYPYYSFSIDDGTTDFNFINAGPDSLVVGTEYTFNGDNTSHPFRMYITDSLGNTTNLVNNLSFFSGSQSFTLDPNIDYSSFTAAYVCNAHPSMAGTFNIQSAIPEPSAYALLLGSLSLALVALRRR